ncbi:MAG: M48 family metalloprotease [Candidatus Acidiferrales bacterium]
MNGIRKALVGGFLATALALAWPVFGSAQTSTSPAPAPQATAQTANQTQTPQQTQQPTAAAGQSANTTAPQPPTQQPAASATQQPTAAPSDTSSPVQPVQQPAPASTATPAAQTQQPAATASTSASGDQEKDVKAGSEQDVNAIGNRKVGSGVNLYSIESEIALGKQAAQEVEKSSKLVDDPIVADYVNRVGQRLVRNSDCKVPFTIKVIDSDEINAFALPGGFFYVNSGLILAADEEAELAGVMGHEIAHVCARHGTRNATKEQIAEWATIPLIMLGPGGWAGYGIYEGLQMAIPIGFLKFSRDAEREADYLGLQYMYKAGYDPNAFVSFFEKIEAMEKRQPGTIPKIFADHPPTPDRMAAAQKEIAEILPARDSYIVTTSEFDQVKARLQRIENKQKVQDAQPGKPTLRTRTDTQQQGTGQADPGSTSTDGSDDPNRPVLKKRTDGPDSNDPTNTSGTTPTGQIN